MDENMVKSFNKPFSPFTGILLKNKYPKVLKELKHLAFESRFHSICNAYFLSKFIKL